MTSVNALIKEQKYETHIRTTDHELVADEPLKDGGQNKGCTPHELLCASLASCTCITLRMYADRKGWDTGFIHTEVVFDTSGEVPVFNRTIKLERTLDEASLKRLLQIADLCPISKLLSTSNPIKTEFL